MEISLMNCDFINSDMKMNEKPIAPIRCPVCKEEYSYGRRIYHTCGDHSIYSGVIYGNERRNYEWNCDTTLACVELTDKKISQIETFGNGMDEINDEAESESTYQWNCNKNLKMEDLGLNDKKLNCFLIYE